MTLKKIAGYLKQSDMRDIENKRKLNNETKQKWTDEKKKLDNLMHKIKIKIKDTEIRPSIQSGVLYYNYEITFDVDGDAQTVRTTLQKELSRVMGVRYRKYFPSVDGYGTVHLMYPTSDILEKNDL